MVSRVLGVVGTEGGEGARHEAAELSAGRQGCVGKAASDESRGRCSRSRMLGPVGPGVAFSTQLFAPAHRGESSSRRHKRLRGIDDPEVGTTVSDDGWLQARFKGCAREYCRAYRNLLLDGVVVKSKELIEKMRTKQKAHRNILDMEPGFLNKQ